MSDKERAAEFEKHWQEGYRKAEQDAASERKVLESQIDELKKQLEFMPALKECSAAHQRRADAAELQVSELRKKLVVGGMPVRGLILLPESVVLEVEKARESSRLNGELTEALRNMTGLFGEAATRHQMGKGFTELHAAAVKTAKDVLSKQDCAHEWAHIEDHHVICKKCNHTADLCWTCESEKTRTRDGGLVCLKCNPQ